jgi:citrate synthase
MVKEEFAQATGFRSIYVSGAQVARYCRSLCSTLMYSQTCVASIGGLRGPKRGGAKEAAVEIQNHYDNRDEAEADIRKRVEARETIVDFGHLYIPFTIRVTRS